MKKVYPFAAIVLFITASCKNPAPVQQQETPKALQENNSDYQLISKSRTYDNLVEQLYNELLEKTPALDSLEQSIDKVTESKTDSAKAFNFFSQKNNSFYGAANSYSAAITDSAVKLRIKNLLDNSTAGYKSKTAAHTNLLEAIDKKNVTLSDLHIVLKLVKTITVMEKYQAAQMPSLKPLQAVSGQFDKVITATDALSRQ